MKPEKQRLIHGLLDDEGRRQATFLAAARALRRRRHWRVARHGLALVMVLAIAAVWLRPRLMPPAPPLQAAAPAPKAAAPVYGQPLTDEELLALFPDTPVGLATLADGRKRLIFPRPGDEERFVTRL